MLSQAEMFVSPCHIGWYTITITDNCRIAPILCCIAANSRGAGLGLHPPTKLTGTPELKAALELPRVRGTMAVVGTGQSARSDGGSPMLIFVGRLRELEATSGIEPEYTVLQTVA